MLSVGQTLRIGGNFTMLGFIEGLDGPGLERTVGFHPGRLEAGFAILVLAPGHELHPNEIALLGSTRWSGGLIGKERREMRALLEERGKDVDQLKAKVCAFFSRRGPRTPAKVLPFTTHSPQMRYPDAEALAPGIRSGVPQFNLLVPRAFSVLRAYAPG